ncbi:MAG TPA: glycosyltransferase family 4 protein [Thermoanaerobaculia bacterium]|nr:glycosyltransferase family 4 protein [Thermoanaerobaculia bacterium]
MARVVFVNRYFHPDHSATSQIASDLAFHLAARGWQVEAIASRQRYDDAAARLPKHETIHGVRVTRLATTRFGRAFLPGRAIDYLTFYLSAFFAIAKRRDAVVIAMTDPPLLSVIATLASKHVVNWLQDLFPEVATALGIRVPRMLRTLRDWSLRRARANVVLGDRMAQRVERAVVIHNWAEASLHPIAREENALRREWNLGESFVVGYSGNLGRVHEFDAIAGAMQQSGEDIRFLFIGGGARLEAVKRAAGANASFQPYQPRERLSESLSAADVHLVSAQPQVEGLVVPSKAYGILAVARPLIFIGDDDGEIARIVKRFDCGIVVPPGDANALATAIRELANDPQRAAAMGRRGRDAYLAHFAPERALAAWERVLEDASR